MFLTSRDMAKIGQLCLQRGTLVNQQVVPEWWITASTKPDSKAADGFYGYNWWVRPGGYAAQGFGGQYIYVLPAEQLVVVLTADPSTGRHLDFPHVERLLTDYIVNAVDSGT